jgi:dihydroorotate dehydrogenase (NAD+) catalytic subunit
VQPTAMTTIIDGLEAFCVHREIARVADLTGGVVIEEADEPDLAWLNPPT